MANIARATSVGAGDAGRGGGRVMAVSLGDGWTMRSGAILRQASPIDITRERR
jgi:hypothetical protein